MNPSDEVHEEHSDIKIEESEEIEVLSLDDIKDNQPRSLISISSKKGSLVNQELFLSITSLTESLREGEEPESLISISSNQSFQSITTSVISSQSESSNPKCWTRNDSWQYRKLRLVKKIIPLLNKLSNQSCNYEIYKCDFEIYKCNFEIYKCSFEIYKCDFDI